MKTILIIGKSDLAKAIENKHARIPSPSHECATVGRPEYDFSKQEHCDRVLNDFPSPSVAINTLGTLTDNYWDSFVSNYVAPAYLTLKYYEQMSEGHIINISSASAWWPSYPGMHHSRFCYSVSKYTLSEFGKHFNRVTIDNDKNVTVTTIEPGAFKSKMSKQTGFDIGRVVDAIDIVMKTKSQHFSLIKE